MWTLFEGYADVDSDGLTFGGPTFLCIGDTPPTALLSAPSTVDDNCPTVSNADQHDEDADSVGDVCDNCPGIANTNQANVGETNNGQGADTVGDACDPRPSQSGDSILVFDPFVGTTLDPQWVNASGTGSFSVQDDALRQTSTTVTGARLEHSGVSGTNYVVESLVTLVQEGSAPNVGLAFRMDNGDDGLVCGVHGDGGFHLWQLDDGGAGLASASTTLNGVGNGDIYRMRAGGYNNVIRCDLTTSNVINVSASGFNGRPGIRTFRMSARFDYFLVYGVGGTWP